MLRLAQIVANNRFDVDCGPRVGSISEYRGYRLGNPTMHAGRVYQFAREPISLQPAVKPLRELSVARPIAKEGAEAQFTRRLYWIGFHGRRISREYGDQALPATLHVRACMISCQSQRVGLCRAVCLFVVEGVKFLGTHGRQS
jgi:hypothetical protein